MNLCLGMLACGVDRTHTSRTPSLVDVRGILCMYVDWSRIRFASVVEQITFAFAVCSGFRHYHSEELNHNILHNNNRSMILL